MRSYYLTMAIFSPVPCLIIGFARKDGVLRTIETLGRAGITHIYLAIDGPRNQAHTLLQEEMIRDANRIAESNGISLNVWKRSANLGVAASVITAIDWFFSRVESGLILEDDLYFDEQFITFATSALSEYKNDKDVWIVSGNNFQHDLSRNHSVNWCTYPLIWGWATWKDRWPEMRASFSSPWKYGRIDMDKAVENFWRTGFERSHAGKIDTWAAPLAAVQHARMKLTVIPPVNLVGNLGADGEASHTENGGQHMFMSIQKLPDRIEYRRNENYINSSETDLLLNRLIFQITARNRFSFVLARIFDWVRYPKSKRLAPLSERITLSGGDY
jgi:hypothetical protein